jgi:hypothetical protein
VSHNFAIVSGSDAAYFGLLRGLVRAIRAFAALAETPLYVFDAGLASEQRDWLTRQGATIARPRWEFDRTVPGFIAMLATRPRIPQCFPGHEAYLWIDADAWPQRLEAVETYHRAALAKGFAVTPEVHATYNARELGEAHKRIRGWYGPDVVRALEGTPPINLGVFAGAADAPHWAAWRRRVDNWLAASTSQQIDFNADQTAFNMVVHADRLETELLPARYNWICHTSTPMVSEDGATLLEPVAPYRPLGMVHMTLWTKKGPQKLTTPGGKTIFRPLTYAAEPLPDSGAALPDFALPNL